MMDMGLTLIHWTYVLFIFLIIGFMVKRLDTTILCIVGIFLVSFIAHPSLPNAISNVFNSFIYAITELLPTILIICIIVAMSKSLTTTGIHDTMISPFAKLIRTPTLAYWSTGILMMSISYFFWPSPAVALIGAILLPIALRVGLPAMGVAVAMNLFGHGIALSGDFVIQAAPKLTGDAAGIPVHEVIQASVPLVITMGIVTTFTAFFLIKRDLKLGKISVEHPSANNAQTHGQLLSKKTNIIMAAIIPLLFIIDIFLMFKLNLQGSDATALVGGTALFILLAIALLGHKRKGLEKTTSYLVDGFQFGFKVFGPVIPIAAFFYLGDAGFTTIVGDYLPQDSNGIVNDLGAALSASVPLTKEVAAVTLTAVGAITGLDGSGFSGISLVGSIAKIFAASIDGSIATLTALGQIAGIWVGGGTIIPWALIPAAAICNVSPFELARRNLLPVGIGLVVTTIVAIILM
jgi:hypothetical protein